MAALLHRLSPRKYHLLTKPRFKEKFFSDSNGGTELLTYFFLALLLFLSSFTVRPWLLENKDSFLPSQ